MNNKFILTDETEEFFGCTLHRIKALKDFGEVKAGELGGWVEKEGNIEVYGNAWVYGNARVYGDARVYGNAEVYGDDDVIWTTGIGSRKGTTTVCRDKDGGLIVSCGCFFGTLDEFAAKVEKSTEIINLGVSTRHLSRW